jgi:hypothetical protein
VLVPIDAHADRKTKRSQRPALARTLRPHSRCSQSAPGLLHPRLARLTLVRMELPVSPWVRISEEFGRDDLGLLCHLGF